MNSASWKKFGQKFLILYSKFSYIYEDESVLTVGRNVIILYPNKNERENLGDILLGRAFRYLKK